MLILVLFIAFSDVTCYLEDTKIQDTGSFSVISRMAVCPYSISISMDIKSLGAIFYDR